MTMIDFIWLIPIGLAFLLGRRTAPVPRRKPLILTIKDGHNTIFKWYVRRVPDQSKGPGLKGHVEELYEN